MVVEISKNEVMRVKRENIFQQIVIYMTSFVGVLVFILCVIVDETHLRRISCSWAIEMHDGLRWIAGWTGLRYSKANSLLENNMGILISVLSLMFTMRESVSNRHEKKVYGIPQSELSKSRARKSYNRIRCVVYLFPFILLLCINLGLCLAGYLVLVYNFLFLYVEFWLLSRSFNRKDDEKKVVEMLLFHAGIKKNGQNCVPQEYRILLGDVRRGIDETEGWTRAEKLYDEFVFQLKMVNIEKSFGLHFYFVKIVFCDSTYSDGGMLLEQYAQRYITELYDMYEDEENGKEAVALYAVLQCAIDIWNAERMQGFIRWMLDFGNRSDIGVQRRTTREKFEVRAEQCAVVLLMLECWLHNYPLREVQFEDDIALLWDYGKIALKEAVMKTCVDCCMSCLQYEKWNTAKYLQYLTQDSLENKGRSTIGLIKRRQERGDKHV